MSSDTTPTDALAGKLKRTELQHKASSIPGREIVQVLTEISAPRRARCSPPTSSRSASRWQNSPVERASFETRNVKGDLVFVQIGLSEAARARQALQVARLGLRCEFTEVCSEVKV